MHIKQLITQRPCSPAAPSGSLGRMRTLGCKGPVPAACNLLRHFGPGRGVSGSRDRPRELLPKRGLWQTSELRAGAQRRSVESVRSRSWLRALSGLRLRALIGALIAGTQKKGPGIWSRRNPGLGPILRKGSERQSWLAHTAQAHSSSSWPWPTETRRKPKWPKARTKERQMKQPRRCCQSSRLRPRSAIDQGFAKLRSYLPAIKLRRPI